MGKLVNHTCVSALPIYGKQQLKEAVVKQQLKVAAVWAEQNKLPVKMSAPILLFLLVAVGVFLFPFYPSVPEIGLVMTRLNHIEIQTTPKPTLNLSFSLTVKVCNKDFFPLSYDSVKVSVSYRGRQIGFVSSVDGGRIRARGSSYVDVVLPVDGFEVIYDAYHFFQDVAKGVIPFVIETGVEGNLWRFFFDFPFKATASRPVYVNLNSVVVNIKRVAAAVALVNALITAILSVLLKQGWIWKLLTYLTGKMLVVCSRLYSVAILLLFLLAVPCRWVKRWIRTLMMVIWR